MLSVGTERAELHKVVVFVIVTDDDQGLVGFYPQWEVGDLDEAEAYTLSAGLRNLVQGELGWVARSPTAVGPRIPTDPGSWPTEDPPIAQGVVTASTLNVRSEPSTSAEIVGTYDQGAIVYVFEIRDNEAEERKWLKVAPGGWAASEWVNITKLAEDEDLDPSNPVPDVYLPYVGKGGS